MIELNNVADIKNFKIEAGKFINNVYSANRKKIFRLEKEEISSDTIQTLSKTFKAAVTQIRNGSGTQVVKLEKISYLAILITSERKFSPIAGRILGEICEYDQTPFSRNLRYLINHLQSTTTTIQSTTNTPSSSTSSSCSEQVDNDENDNQVDNIENEEISGSFGTELRDLLIKQKEELKALLKHHEQEGNSDVDVQELISKMQKLINQYEDR